MPEVDCVSLGVPGEEGSRPGLGEGIAKRKGDPPGLREEPFTPPANLVSYLPGEISLIPRDCLAGKWAEPSACCSNNRSNATRSLPVASVVFWGEGDESPHCCLFSSYLSFVSPVVWPSSLTCPVSLTMKGFVPFSCHSHISTFLGFFFMSFFFQLLILVFWFCLLFL